MATFLFETEFEEILRDFERFMTFKIYGIPKIIDRMPSTSSSIIGINNDKSVHRGIDASALFAICIDEELEDLKFYEEISSILDSFSLEEIKYIENHFHNKYFGNSEPLNMDNVVHHYAALSNKYDYSLSDYESKIKTKRDLKKRRKSVWSEIKDGKYQDIISTKVPLSDIGSLLKKESRNYSGSDKNKKNMIILSVLYLQKDISNYVFSNELISIKGGAKYLNTFRKSGGTRL